MREWCAAATIWTIYEYGKDAYRFLWVGRCAELDEFQLLHCSIYMWLWLSVWQFDIG